jgi:hypothetical protein
LDGFGFGLDVVFSFGFGFGLFVSLSIRYSSVTLPTALPSLTPRETPVAVLSAAATAFTCKLDALLEAARQIGLAVPWQIRCEMK